MTKLTELKVLMEKATLTFSEEDFVISNLPALIQVAEAAEGILPVIGDRALYGSEHKRLLDALAQLKENH